jgi:hypothetical protein
VTKPSPIMICPKFPLAHLPMAEQDVLRRFFCEHVRGMSRADDKRWRRFIRQLWRAEPGEGFQLYRVEERSGPFHNRHRVILERLFQSQERFRHIDKLHDWLKLGAGFVTWAPGKDSKPVAIPRSTSFPECSEDDMRQAHTEMVDYLHTERAQRFLWRHLKPDKRAEMLDSVLKRDTEQES